MDKKEMLKKCLDLFHEQDVVNFTAQLVKTKSFPPEYNEKKIAELVAQKFAEYGIDSHIDTLDQPNRANLIASIGSENRPNLLFSGHFDTVPPVEEGWNHNPFSATIEDGRMYGRGTGDMKGGDAALVMAMCILKKAEIPLKGKITFVGTCGEEVDRYGSKAYYSKYGCDDIDAMVIAEATNRGMFTSEKGALWLKFTAHGKAAHPGVSWEGVNSLLNTLKFFEEFRKYRFSVEEHEMLGKPTLNITSMHAGTITNALPVSCISTVDIRTIPGIRHDDILRDIDALIIKLKEEDPQFNLSYEVTNDCAPIETNVNDPLCIAAYKANEDLFEKELKPTGVFFYTDAVSLVRSDGTYAPMIIYGPGDATNNHKVNEFVEVSQLIDATKFYMALAINYLTEE